MLEPIHTNLDTKMYNVLPNIQGPKKMLLHIEHINAIMISMKPSLWQYYFVRITKEMLKAYFKDIRQQYKYLDLDKSNIN